MASLNSLLKKYKRERKKIYGDGNCLFRAFSFQLTGKEENHPQIREKITAIESLEAFKDLYGSLEAPKHHSIIANAGIYGTDMEIIAASILWERDIYVATDQLKPPTWLLFTPNKKIEKPKISPTITDLPDWIEIVYVNQNHYDATKPIGSERLSRPDGDITPVDYHTNV